MDNKISKNLTIIIITFSFFFFFMILRDVFINEITSYDNWAYGVFVEDLRNDNLTIIMKIITFFGSGIALGLGVSLFFLIPKDKKIGIISFSNLLIIFLLNSALKAIIQRPRPTGYNLIEESNYSFPSGHSMISTAFYGFLIYLIYKNIKNKKVKISLITLLFLLIIFICISRVYLGVHYLSDTLAGFFFSIAYLMIFVSLLPKINIRSDKNEKKKTKN